MKKNNKIKKAAAKALSVLVMVSVLLTSIPLETFVQLARDKNVVDMLWHAAQSGTLDKYLGPTEAQALTCGASGFTDIGGGVCRGFISGTGPGQFTIPNDWTSTNTIEAIGGGGAGGLNIVDASAGGGGGGYSIATNIAGLSGNIDYSVGARGTPSATQSIADGDDTWFGDTTCGAAEICAGGGTGALNESPAGTGGTGGAGTADTGFNGGNGGTSGSAVDDGGGGGGGAAGVEGAGGNGGAASADGGAGGGGAGDATPANGSDSTSDTGGAGGAGRGESGGGTVPGGAGTAGTGGGGGGGSDLSTETGGNGATGNEWTSHGSGGGGGGGADAGTGGIGGLYGGGGGGHGEDEDTGTNATGGGGLLVITYTSNTNPILAQNYYRFRDDTTALNTDGGYLEAQNTNIIIDEGSTDTMRLRFEIANTGFSSATNYNYRLEYATNPGSCSSGSYATVPVTATTEPFEMVLSSQYADAAAISASRLTATGSFVNGIAVEDPSTSTGNHTLAVGEYSEFEYAIAPTASADAGSYCFRLTNVGSTTNFSYSVYPEVSIASNSRLFWKFDEGQGTTAQDTSISNLDGTLGTGSSAPTWTTNSACLFNDCLRFESNDYVTKSDSSFLDFGSTDSFTVEAWTRHGTISTSEDYLITKSQDGTAGGYKLWMDSDGDFCFGIDDDSSWGPDISACSSAKDFDDSKWHFVAGVRSVTDDAIYIYVDGVRYGNTNDSTSATLANANAFYTGIDRNGASNGWSGFVDEVKVIAEDRSADEIKADFVARGSIKGVSAQFGDGHLGETLSSGLVGHWNMDTTGTGFPVAADKGDAYSSSDGDLLTSRDVDLPNTTKPGDLLVLLGGVDFASGTFTVTTGWNQLYLTTADGGASHRSFAYYHIADGTEGATVNITTDVERNTAARVWRIVNWHGTTPPEITTTTGTDANPNPPSLTPSWGTENTLWIAHTGWNPTGNFTSHPTNYSNYQENGTGGSTAGSAYAASARETSASSEDPGTFTLTASSAWGAHTIAIRPAGVPDASGNSYTLTNNNSTTFLTGKYFKGSEHVPASSQYLSTATTINGVKSVSFWTNPDSTTNYFISLTASAYITASSGTLSATGFTNPKIYVNGVESTTIAADTWQYITVTTDTAINADTFYVGRQGANYYDGTLDEVRIYNRTLAPNEVTTLYNWAPGPIGYWDMDENSGITTNDTSGNSNNGTLIGGATWGPGKFGNGVNFDGTNDYVRMDNFSTATAGTVTAWIKTNSHADNDTIFASGDTASSTRYFHFRITDSGTQLGIAQNNNGTEDQVRSTTTLTPNTWYFLALTSDGTAWKIYINGAVTGLSITGGSNTGDWLGDTSDRDNITIGALVRSSTAHLTGGIVDDVRLYNYPRTPAQIIEDMNSGHQVGGSPVGSQVAYWKFDDMTGTTAQDASVKLNTLTLNTASWTSAGKFGGAWNGTGGAIRMSRTNDADLDFSATEDFSLSLWYKTDSASNPGSTEYLVSTTTANADAGYSIYANTSGNLCFGIDDDTTWGPDIASCTTDDVYDGLWHHVLAIRDNLSTDKTYLYIDGVLKDSDPDTTTATLDGDNTFFVGDIDTNDDGEEFSGDIDEFKVYRAALTAPQIQTELNQGKSIVWGSLSTGVGGTSPSWNQDRSYCVPGDGTTCNRPIGEWRFDENMGASAYDTTGAGNTGTLTSGPVWTPGIEGSAIQFDGSDDYVSVTDTTTLEPATTLSLSAWVKTTQSGTNFAGIIDKYTGSAAGYLMDFPSGTNMYPRIGVRTTNGGAAESVTGTISLNDGKWHYIAGTFDGTNCRIYIDGILNNTASCSGTMVYDTHDFIIGGDGVSTNRLRGYIDNVRIYDYVRTPAQIAWEYDQGKPSAWYKFDEGTSTIVNNSGSVGIGITAVLGSGSSAPTWTTSGKRNGALSFDGGDYIETSDNGFLHFNEAAKDFSVFAWIKRAATGAIHHIISKEDADNDGWRLMINADDTVTCSIDAIDITSTVTIDTQWRYVGCTIDRDGTGMVYIDGRPSSSATSISSEVMATTTQPRIGTRSYTSTGYFNGQIDEIKLFNYSLTQNQIRTVMNEGAVGFR